MIRPAVLLAFLAAVFPLVATPGASLTLLIREVTAHGRHRAVPVVLGTVTGLYVHAALAAAGLSALVMHSSRAFEFARLAGAAYLVLLGAHCLRADPVSPGAASQGPAALGPHDALATYRQAVLANVLNPKAASIFLTLVPQFLDPHRPLAPQFLTFATAQSALVCTWLAGWTALLAGAGRFLNSARAKRIWQRAAGYVLIGLGLRSAVA